MDRKESKKLLVFAVLLIIGIIAAFVVFLKGNSDRIARQNEEYLYELTVQRAESIETRVEENLKFIRSTAFLFGESLDDPKPSSSMLKEFEENSSFDMLRFVYKNGDDYTSDGIKANLADDAFFQDGMNGATGSFYIKKSKVTGSRQIGFYAPVFYKDRITGVMLGIYEGDRLMQMLDFDLFGEKGESWLCDSTGFVISTTEDTKYENYFDYLEKEGGCTAEEIANIRHLFSKGQGASFTYNKNGEIVNCCAAGIPAAGWVIIRNFPPAAYSQILRNANRNGVTLVIHIIILFAIFAALISLSFTKEIKRMIKEQREAEYVALGVARIYGSCMTLDLNTNVYEYVIGEPDSPGLSTTGYYLRYYDALMSRIRDTENRRLAASFFELDNLKKIFNNTDIAEMKVHDVKDGEEAWEKFTFLVIKRDGTRPERLLLVSEPTEAPHKKHEFKI